MKKHAIIIVALKPESASTGNDTLKREIREALESNTPNSWFERILQVTIVKPE